MAIAVTTPKGSSDTREAILDATDRLLARGGFRQVTMEDIGREAGVSRRTVYMYFPTKQDVGLSSIDRVVEGAQQRLREIAAGGGDPADILRDILIERVLFRVESIRDYRQSLDELFEAVRPAYMERRRRHFAREAEIIAGVLAAGRERGRFEVADPMATSMTLVQATNAFLPYSLSVEELGDRALIEAGVRRMADLLLRGLTGGGRRPGKGGSH
jgi:AcrR family transcriptional regulator